MRRHEKGPRRLPEGLSPDSESSPLSPERTFRFLGFENAYESYVPSKTNEGQSLDCPRCYFFFFAAFFFAGAFFFALPFFAAIHPPHWEAARRGLQPFPGENRLPSITSTVSEYRGAFPHESRVEPSFWKFFFKMARDGTGVIR